MAKNIWVFAPVRVMQRRKFMRMTQSDLSDKTGISQTSISSIEKGRKQPKASTICRFCDALKCTPSMFFYPPDED